MSERLELSKANSTVSRGARLVMGTLGNLEGLSRRLNTTNFPNASSTNITQIKSLVSEMTTSLNQLVTSTQGATVTDLEERLGTESKTRGKAQTKARATCPDDAPKSGKAAIGDRLAKVPAK